MQKTDNVEIQHFKDTIVNSLEHFDRNFEKNKKLFTHVKYYKIVPNENDLEHNVIYFYNSDKEEIYKSRYEVLGLYNNDVKIWAWAWSLPYLTKNNSYISRKILNYGLNISPDELIKAELITSRFRISSLIQLDIYVALASYISKYSLIHRLVFKPAELKYNVPIKVDKSIEYLENFAIYYLFLLD